MMYVDMGDLGDLAGWFIHGLWDGYHCLLLPLVE